MHLRSIAMFGLFGAKNIGNEATLAATVHALRTRLPEARLSLISAALDPAAGLEGSWPLLEPDALPMSRHLHGISSQRVRTIAQRITEPLRRRRTRAQAKGLDLLVVPGTGIADDFGQGPLDAPSQLRRWCAVARDQGAAVRFASIGAGPVQDALSRRWFADALRTADYRSYRDQQSKNFAMQVGVGAAKDQVLPDLVFSLPLPASVSAQRVTWPPRTVGIGVMGYFGWNAESEAGKAIYATYMGKLTRLVRELLARGYAVRLLTGSRGMDKHAVSDLTAAMRTGNELAQGLTAQPIFSYIDLLGQIAQTDLVIATRFHNVLLALMLGRPVISLGYAQKNDDLMAQMGFTGYCHAVETFDAGQVLAQFESLAAMPQPPVETALRQAAAYRDLLERQYDHVFGAAPVAAERPSSLY